MREERIVQHSRIQLMTEDAEQQIARLGCLAEEHYALCDETGRICA